MDSDGNVLLPFSKEVSVESAIHEKFIAFREEMLVAAASCWVSSHSFLFKSHSHSIVTWVVDPASAPWRFINVVQECCHVFGYNFNWSIKHIVRSGNDAVDILARLDLSSLSFIEFG